MLAVVGVCGVTCGFVVGGSVDDGGGVGGVCVRADVGMDGRVDVVDVGSCVDVGVVVGGCVVGGWHAGVGSVVYADGDVYWLVWYLCWCWWC